MLEQRGRFYQHRDVPKGEIHSCVNWIFINEAGMLEPDVSITFRDLGKIARLETPGATLSGEYYILHALQQSTGAPIWRRIDSPPSAGEANSGANLSDGAQVYAGKSGTTLNFRTVKGTAARLTVTQSDSEIVLDVASNFTLPWSNVSGKPSTLVGYGITDAAAANHSHGIVNNAAAGFMSPAMLALLQSINPDATENSTDAYLLDLANATGVLPAAQVSGLDSAIEQNVKIQQFLAKEYIPANYPVELAAGGIRKCRGKEFLGISIETAPTSDTVIAVQTAGLYNSPLGIPGNLYADENGLFTGFKPKELCWLVGNSFDGTLTWMNPRPVNLVAEHTKFSMILNGNAAFQPTPWNNTAILGGSLDSAKGLEAETYADRIAVIGTTTPGSGMSFAYESMVPMKANFYWKTSLEFVDDEAIIDFIIGDTPMTYGIPANHIRLWRSDLGVLSMTVTKGATTLTSYLPYVDLYGKVKIVLYKYAGLLSLTVVDAAGIESGVALNMSSIDFEDILGYPQIIATGSGELSGVVSILDYSHLHYIT